MVVKLKRFEDEALDRQIRLIVEEINNLRQGFLATSEDGTQTKLVRLKNDGTGFEFLDV